MKVRTGAYALRVPSPPQTRQRLARALGAIALCVALAALAGCGSSDEQFSSGEADRALAALDAAQEQIDDGRCSAVQRSINKLATQASHINEDRPELGEAWAQSVQRLRALALRECVEITPEGPTPAITPETGATGRDPDQSPEPDTPSGPTAPGDGGANPDQPDTEPDQPSGGNQGGGGDTTVPEDSGGAAPGT